MQRRSFKFKLTSSGIALLAAAIAFTGVTTNTPKARAQVTAKTLIGDAVSGDPEKYTDVVEAIKRFVNRDYLASRTLLERAKQQHPRLPPVDLTLAKMYVLSGQNAAARAALERTVRDAPRDPETNYC